jgi:hypothetical protein
MPSWDELLKQASSKSDQAKTEWLVSELTGGLKRISELRQGRNVILYGSAFLQKPQAAGSQLSITHEELNGLMSVIYKMYFSKPLTLLLHTPGGVVNATESIVDYLRSKFDEIEVIVPVLAMSAGTMIALASDGITMGRQSQLGPIDPQIVGGGRSVSARAVVEQFDEAVRQVSADVTLAHVWAPILQSLGPALLQEAKNNLAYSETMVAKWLAQYMFRNDPDGPAKGARVANHFNDATTHKSHGRRIGRDEAKSHGVAVTALEDSQDLQEAVLTVYHLMTILFEQTAITKLLWSQTNRTWVKNLPQSASAP